MLPLFNAPTAVTLLRIPKLPPKYVVRFGKATCFIVPLSFTTNLSASTRVVEVADVSPSIMFNSAAVAVTAVPLRVSASVSKVPSTSTSPDTSKEAASSSPVIVTFLAPVKSLLLSTTTALDAATVPAVMPSIVSNSASFISAEPITKLVPVIVVPVIAAALEPPIVAPSIVPPLISAVSATRASILAVPSMYKLRNSEPTAPIS